MINKVGRRRKGKTDGRRRRANFPWGLGSRGHQVVGTCTNWNCVLCGGWWNWYYGQGLREGGKAKQKSITGQFADCFPSPNFLASPPIHSFINDKPLETNMNGIHLIQFGMIFSIWDLAHPVINLIKMFNLYLICDNNNFVFSIF